MLMPTIWSSIFVLTTAKPICMNHMWFFSHLHCRIFTFWEFSLFFSSFFYGCCCMLFISSGQGVIGAWYVDICICEKQSEDDKMIVKEMFGCVVLTF